jgi:hypothetical protein
VEDKKMQKVNNVSVVSAAFAVLTLVLLAGFPSAAQNSAPAKQIVYQAQAMGTLTQMGKNFNVTIRINEFSSDEERQILADAFNKARSQGLYNALEKMSSKGRIAITGTLGYDISYVRKISTPDGFKIRVLTNRPIRIGEAWVNGRSMSYNLSYFELNISEDKSKNSGTLIPACEFKIDKKTGEVVVEAFQNPWKLTNIMDRTND